MRVAVSGLWNKRFASRKASLKAGQLEGNPFVSSSKGLQLCAHSLSTLIGAVAKSSEEKDPGEAMGFFNEHGLTVSGGWLELNWSALLEPKGVAQVRKSVFITQKLTASIGEIVTGGPLPPTPAHRPVCSFNFQDKYIGECQADKPPPSTQTPSWDETTGGRGECAVETGDPRLSFLLQPLSGPASSSGPRVLTLSLLVTPSPFQSSTQQELLPPEPRCLDSDNAHLAQQAPGWD
ncbi:80 kDa MCM3-associated protein [Tupaia chinensis]|uniref:80 kDa MCM3-associated protein n=1 Tax=Tupaia chinensis TaxID=246437 RepID=L9KZ84_TUPCH|nr:80 kDa MCM3-associated protein [Tupaia chinensis]